MKQLISYIKAKNLIDTKNQLKNELNYVTKFKNKLISVNLIENFVKKRFKVLSFLYKNKIDFSLNYKDNDIKSITINL